MRRATVLLAICMDVNGLAATAALEFVTLDAVGELTPCRIHLRDASGKPVKASGLPFWSNHFVCTGKVSLSLSPGEYRYEIERGPEYHSISNSITPRDDTAVSVTGCGALSISPLKAGGLAKPASAWRDSNRPILPAKMKRSNLFARLKPSGSENRLRRFLFLLLLGAGEFL